MQHQNRGTRGRVLRLSEGVGRIILRPGIVCVILASILMVGCRSIPIEASTLPAIVEATDQEGINRVILTEKAAQRLDIQTAQMREEQMDGAMRLVVPYAALIYDLQGMTWIYTNPEPLNYIREPVTVDHIGSDLAFLTEGPAVGTEVVIVGVAELYGTDTGVGK